MHAIREKLRININVARTRRQGIGVAIAKGACGGIVGRTQPNIEISIDNAIDQSSGRSRTAISCVAARGISIERAVKIRSLVSSAAKQNSPIHRESAIGRITMLRAAPVPLVREIGREQTVPQIAAFSTTA
jgi:hypothetical protein